MAESTKVGIISCSGEEIPAGTVARLATRRTLELLRPQSTVTLCLPLFLAGEESERRFAQQHPTITVDGCEKLCAKRGTEAYSGQVEASLVVSEILGDRLAGCHRSQRHLDKHDEEAVWVVSERIAAAVDDLLQSGRATQEPSATDAAPAAGGVCSCGSGKPAPEGALRVNGREVAIPGLPLIFEQQARRGLEPGDPSGDHLLAAVRIYHPISTEEQSSYRVALVGAYQLFHRRRTAVERKKRKETKHKEEKST